MWVQMKGEAAEKFALENQKIALGLGRSFGGFLSLFIVFYAIGKKIWSVTREKRQDGEAEQQLWGAGEGRQESYPGLASGSALRPLPSPDPGGCRAEEAAKGPGRLLVGVWSGGEGSRGGQRPREAGPGGAGGREPLRLRRERRLGEGEPEPPPPPETPKSLWGGSGEGGGVPPGGSGALRWGGGGRRARRQTYPVRWASAAAVREGGEGGRAGGREEEPRLLLLLLPLLLLLLAAAAARSTIERWLTREGRPAARPRPRPLLPAPVPPARQWSTMEGRRGPARGSAPLPRRRVYKHKRHAARARGIPSPPPPRPPTTAPGRGRARPRRGQRPLNAAGGSRAEPGRAASPPPPPPHSPRRPRAQQPGPAALALPPRSPQRRARPVPAPVVPAGWAAGIAGGPAKQAPRGAGHGAARTRRGGGPALPGERGLALAPHQSTRHLVAPPEPVLLVWGGWVWVLGLFFLYAEATPKTLPVSRPARANLARICRAVFLVLQNKSRAVGGWGAAGVTSDSETSCRHDGPQNKTGGLGRKRSLGPCVGAVELWQV